MTDDIAPFNRHRYAYCEACGGVVETTQPGVGKSTNDERWWHPWCPIDRGDDS